MYLRELELLTIPFPAQANLIPASKIVHVHVHRLMATFTSLAIRMTDHWLKNILSWLKHNTTSMIFFGMGNSFDHMYIKAVEH